MIRVHVRAKPDREHLQLYYVDPLTGADRTRSAKTTNWKDAERAAAIWEQELATHSQSVGDVSWDSFRVRFEDEHLAGLPLKTKRAYGTALNHFERLTGHPRSLSLVSTSVLSQFLAAMRAEDRPATSIATHLRHVRSALSWAAKIGLIAAVPEVLMPRTGKSRHAKSRPVTEAEFHQMLAAVPAVRPRDTADWQRLLWLLWYSGLRLDEAVRLSWDRQPLRVDLDAKPYPLLVIHAAGQKSKADESVPLPPDFADWLRSTPPAARIGRVAPFTHSKPGLVLASIGESAGIVVNDSGKHASAHDIRRAFATRWAAKVHPSTLQRLMRHRSIETTLRYYVDRAVEDIGRDLWRQ